MSDFSLGWGLFSQNHLKISTWARAIIWRMNHRQQTTLRVSLSAQNIHLTIWRKSLRRTCQYPIHRSRHRPCVSIYPIFLPLPLIQEVAKFDPCSPYVDLCVDAFCAVSYCEDCKDAVFFPGVAFGLLEAEMMFRGWMSLAKDCRGWEEQV
jgi:hypothetical protein